MASNSLSEHEVAMLLQGSTEGESSESPSVRDQSAHAAEVDQRCQSQDEHVARMLDQIHENVSKRLREVFAKRLRRPVQLELLSSTHITYEEFALTTDNPTCLIVLHSCRFDQIVLLEIQHNIVFQIIDALLGGADDCSYSPRRPLTEIEKGIVVHFVDSLVGQVEASWSPWGGLGCMFDRIESTGLGLDLMDRGVSLLLVSMQLAIGSSRGLMQLCLPESIITELRPALSSEGEGSLAAPQAPGFSCQAEVDVIATFARASISAAEFNELRPGDVLSTEVNANALVELELQHGPLFLGHAGAIDGCKAVKIKWPVQRRAPASESKAA